jgi:DNA-directed RNA polymerase subunit RPC12/RpoP
MYACNNCGTDVDEQNMLTTSDGEILCADCYEEEN